MTPWTLRALTLGTSLALALGCPSLSLASLPQDDENPILTLVKSRVPDPSKPFILVVRLQVVAGQGPTLEKAFAPAIKATLEEKGCLRYELSRDSASPDSYMIYERWNTVPDLQNHLQAPHITRLLEALANLTAQPPSANVLLPVGQ